MSGPTWECPNRYAAVAKRLLRPAFTPERYPEYAGSVRPRRVGRNSLYVMICISAPTILRASWYSRSSSQNG